MITNRIGLAEHFAELGFTKGAEVGVADGRYSEILLQKIKGLKLIAVDPFYRNGHEERAMDRFKNFPGQVDVKKKTSMEAIPEVSDESLDFVFIDGNHKFDYVMEDLIGWARKVRKGGIVALHDYYFFHDSGVVEAVNKYTEMHKIELNLIPRYKGGHIDDQVPCAWFYKP